MASDSVFVVTSYEDQEQADQAIDALRQEGFGDQGDQGPEGEGRDDSARTHQAWLRRGRCA